MNYYEILKVSRKATDQEIKSSYKSLVKKYHPDLYVGDKEFAEKKIKEINEAYDILSNADTKAEYDEYLSASTQPATFYTSNVTQSTEVKEETIPQEKSEESEPQWSLTRFLSEKFSSLDKKIQLQIFIIILVVILSLFLINLIQVQYYLTNHTSDSSNTVNTSNTIENNTTNFIDKPSQDDNYYEENDFQTLDDLFYDLFESYETENYYDYNTIYQNLF